LRKLNPKFKTRPKLNPAGKFDFQLLLESMGGNQSKITVDPEQRVDDGSEGIKDKNILVLGAGSFGTCLGNHLADLEGIPLS
jgi:hypothetical protein